MSDLDSRSPANMVDETLLSLNPLLARYLLQRYREEYASTYQNKITEILRSFARVSFESEELFCRSLDTQALIDLILKNREIFQVKPGRLFTTYATEISEFRNRWAHQRYLSLRDTFRLADTCSRLCELMEYDEDTREPFEATRSLLLSNNTTTEEGRCFTAKMIELKKSIERLTNEQFIVLQWLLHHRRTVVQGCAGSGKTLVAIELAQRFARVGQRVLFLCHNPHLARYVAELLDANTHPNLEICDFGYFVQQSAIGWTQVGNTDDSWNYYHEPTDSELSQAGKYLKSQNFARIDVVIIDEAQDFKETWWSLIDETLIRYLDCKVFAFCDDNQALLPLRSRIPFENSPFSLSKNCRNGGAIFDIVKRFHPQAPETSLELNGKGRYKKIESGSEEEDFVILQDSIQEILSILPPASHCAPHSNNIELVVLTTEVPAERSSLNGFEFVYGNSKNWQKEVRSILNTLQLRSAIVLSDNLFPTVDDIKAVSNATIEYLECERRYRTGFPRWIHSLESTVANPEVKWLWDEKKGRPIIAPKTNRRLSHTDFSLNAAAFLAQRNWHLELPGLQAIKIGIKTPTDFAGKHIPLYSVSDFKGLESDCVLLVTRTNQLTPFRDLALANLYVGCSRARLILYVICRIQGSTYLKNLL